MRKNTATKSGIINLRVLAACALFSVSGLLTFLSFAATPSSGTLTEVSGPLTYTSGPFVVSNPSGFVGGDPICAGAAQPCDDYALTVTVPAGYNLTHNVVISTAWPIAAEDYDIYLYQGATQVKAAASSSDPEVMIVDAVSGAYTIRIVPFAVAGGTTTTTIELREKPTSTPPDPAGPGTPRYHNFAAPPALGNSAGEPTLAPGKQSLGDRTMYLSGLETLRATWNDCTSPASGPGFPDTPGSTVPLWEDVSAPTTSVVSLDPILFGDNATGRIFVSQLGPKTSFLAYTDNDGGVNGQAPLDWFPSQGSGINSGVDHQTVGGGPFRPGLPDGAGLYPNAVYYASQDVAIAQMALSRTGGETFGPAVPMYNLTQCGGLHGHTKVTPSTPATVANGHVGTVYSPNKGCSSPFSGQAVVVSEDEGVTFAVRPVPGSSAGDTDPSVGIDADGKIYFAYADGDGHAKVATSTDKGVTWSPPVDVGAPFGIENTVFPGAVGGSAGRATVMYLATDTDGNYEATGVFPGVWHIYASHTFDGGTNWTTVRVTPENDPVQRGSICTGGTTCGADRNLLDFNDVEIDHEGRVIIAYADGCIGCTSPTGNDSRADKATIARQSGGKRMLAGFGPEDTEPNPPAAPLVKEVSKDANGVVHVKWAEPDNGGAALTGYNVYRSTEPGVYGPPLASPSPDKTTYDDPTTVPGTPYFYKVTALNIEGEGPNCEEFPIGVAGPTVTHCILDGIPVQEDPAGDNTDNPNAQRDLLRLSLAELYDPANANNKLYITTKVGNLSPIPEPSSRWTTFFTRVNPPGSPPAWGATTEWFVAMVTDDTASPGTPVYRYGHTSIGAGGIRQLTTDGTADSGINTLDGKILITISTPTQTNFGASGRAFPALATGEALTNINAITQQSGGVLLLTVDSTGNGAYTLQGNASCRPNLAPIPALIAYPVGSPPTTPPEGDAPLAIQFDASGSSDPDTAPPADTIASYKFNFGDGSPEVTQASPLISHTYTDWGFYRASVRVTDSRGKVSDSVADKVIRVGLPLTDVRSRKVHGPPGATTPIFDILLPVDGTTRGVECRSGGASNAHTLIYTFDRDLDMAFVPTANVAQGTATIDTANSGFGPLANQFTVKLTGVLNVQHLVVHLDGVHDVAGAILNDVPARMDVVLGDTTEDGGVNSADVTQVRRSSGQAASATDNQFRRDLTTDGGINSADITVVRRQSGTGFPP